MSESQNILKEVKPRLHALIDEFVAKGADRSDLHDASSNRMLS